MQNAEDLLSGQCWLSKAQQFEGVPGTFINLATKAATPCFPAPFHSIMKCKHFLQLLAWFIDSVGYNILCHPKKQKDFEPVIILTLETPTTPL